MLMFQYVQLSQLLRDLDIDTFTQTPGARGLPPGALWKQDLGRCLDDQKSYCIPYLSVPKYCTVCLRPSSTGGPGIAGQVGVMLLPLTRLEHPRQSACFAFWLALSPLASLVS